MSLGISIIHYLFIMGSCFLFLFANSRVYAQISDPALLSETPKVRRMILATESPKARRIFAARALLFNLEDELSTVNPDDIKEISKLGRRLQEIADRRPRDLMFILRAFGNSGSMQRRNKAVDKAREIGFIRADDRDPQPIIGWILLGALAILAGSGCDADEPCGCGSSGPTDPDNPDVVCTTGGGTDTD
ncbi:hypothetical protein [Candidatus Nitrospira neomarina]|uniref:Uncharacterized protein n=1 Tax=Candidatus Nitrospira neomarina TaxID=3020899 RepID=A0AA96GLH3_9BACT|nr:hypothetical protein [Candidatus Nitrospira neomarina]WNM62495.1 hypothetical protein PQG83_01755 [Candidatus Nitrospira neomarina]